MDPLSYLQKIPGVSVQELNKAEISEGRNDRQFCVTVDKDNFDYTKQTVFYEQTSKNISIIDRFKLGRLIGCDILHSIAFAIFTSLKSKESVTRYYLDKLKKVSDPNILCKKSLKYYYKEKPEERDLLEKRVALALNCLLKPEDFNPRHRGIGEAALYVKAMNDIEAMDYNSEKHQLKIQKDRNQLQTIGDLIGRGQRYLHPLFHDKDPIKDLTGKLNPDQDSDLISEDLLSITEERILKESQKIQETFLDILGFKPNLHP